MGSAAARLGGTAPTILLLMTKHPASAFFTPTHRPLVSVKSLIISGIKRRKNTTPHTLSHSISLYFCKRSRKAKRRLKCQSHDRSHILIIQKHFSSAVRSSMSQEFFSLLPLVPLQSTCLGVLQTSFFEFWGLLWQRKWWMNWSISFYSLLWQEIIISQTLLTLLV